MRFEVTRFLSGNRVTPGLDAVDTERSVAVGESVPQDLSGHIYQRPRDGLAIAFVNNRSRDRKRLVGGCIGVLRQPS